MLALQSMGGASGGGCFTLITPILDLTLTEFMSSFSKSHTRAWESYPRHVSCGLSQSLV